MSDNNGSVTVEAEIPQPEQPEINLTIEQPAPETGSQIENVPVLTAAIESMSRTLDSAARTMTTSAEQFQSHLQSTQELRTQQQNQYNQMDQWMERLEAAIEDQIQVSNNLGSAAESLRLVALRLEQQIRNP